MRPQECRSGSHAVLGSAQRPELPAPAQLSRSCAAVLTQSLITRPQALRAGPCLPVRRESRQLCFLQLQSCSGRWGWGEQREPAWVPHQRGCFWGAGLVGSLFEQLGDVSGLSEGSESFHSQTAPGRAALSQRKMSQPGVLGPAAGAAGAPHVWSRPLLSLVQPLAAPLPLSCSPPLVTCVLVPRDGSK